MLPASGRFGFRTHEPQWPIAGSMLSASLTNLPSAPRIFSAMIRKLKSGEFRLYSRKKDAKTGKRKNLGTFSSLAAAKKHERAVQYFKRHG